MAVRARVAPNRASPIESTRDGSSDSITRTTVLTGREKRVRTEDASRTRSPAVLQAMAPGLRLAAISSTQPGASAAPDPSATTRDRVCQPARPSATSTTPSACTAAYAVPAGTGTWPWTVSSVRT